MVGRAGCPSRTDALFCIVPTRMCGFGLGGGGAVWLFHRTESATGITHIGDRVLS